MQSLPKLWKYFRTQVIKRKFVRDVGVLTIANLVAAMLSFAQGIFVARWLGPERYGMAALVMTYPGLVFAFFDARSAEASVKYLSEFYARGDRDRVLGICKFGYIIDLAIALLAFFTVLVTASWAAKEVARNPEAVGLIAIYAAAFIPQSLVGTSRAVLTTLGKFSLMAWINVLMTFWRSLLVISLVLGGWQVAGVVWGGAISTSVTGLVYGAIAFAIIYRRWGAFPHQGKWHAIARERPQLVRFLFYNSLTSLLGIVTKQLDVLILGYFRNPTEVGYYKLAKSLTGVVGYLVKPLQSVTYPEMAIIGGLGNGKALTQKVRRLALQVGLPLGLAVLAIAPFAPWILPLLVGSSYGAAVPGIQLLSIGFAMWLAVFWLRPLFLVRSWLQEWTLCTFFFSLCSLIGWLVFVPAGGYLAASAWWSIATIFAYSIPPLIIFRMKTIQIANKPNWDDYTAQLVSQKGATATDFELLKSYGRGRVLDAGCGTGIHIGRLAALAEVEAAVGVDLGKPGLIYGKANFPTVTFLQASLDRLPFEDNYFDLIYSLDVVEHLLEPSLAIKEFHRTCKPGGFVFLQTPNYPVKRVYDAWHWLRQSRKTLSDDPTHVYHFNSFKLQIMVRSSGLQVVHLSARNLACDRLLPGGKQLRHSWVGHWFGQKTIIIATKV